MAGHRHLRALEGALPPDDIAVAIRVLSAEADALRRLAGALDERFVQAVNAIDRMRNEGRGRLIVAGIGKSGHVARKIAATLASTGTPSYFVHPGEASHGDLGMIAESDVVVLLSNSGESPELSDMIAYTRRFRIPLIAMTANPEGALAVHADIVLHVPKIPEACPNNLAPTTSTTMMMALGDALAIALLERTGLSADDFRVFHPGGKLGQRLLKVEDLMQRGDALPLVSEDARMDAAILVLTEKNLGCLLVVDAEGFLTGIITDGDLKRHMKSGLLERFVREIMTSDPRTIEGHLLAAEALDTMLRGFARPVTSLVVTDSDGKPVGLIRVQDCLQAGVA